MEIYSGNPIVMGEDEHNLGPVYSFICDVLTTTESSSEYNYYKSSHKYFLSLNYRNNSIEKIINLKQTIID